MGTQTDAQKNAAARNAANVLDYENAHGQGSYYRQGNYLATPASGFSTVGSDAYRQAADMYKADYDKAASGYASSLAAFSAPALQAATAQGIENVYGSENTYGAMGGGSSGAAQAAASRGMAVPMAEAQKSIAGMAAQQQGQLAQLGSMQTQGLVEGFTGTTAPVYSTEMSQAEKDAAVRAQNEK